MTSPGMTLLLLVAICIFVTNGAAAIALPTLPTALATTVNYGGWALDWMMASFRSLSIEDGRSAQPTQLGHERNPLTFALDSVRHHSSHERYLGMSASYQFSQSDSPIPPSHAAPSDKVWTKTSRVRRLVDPKGYVAQRDHLLSSAKGRSYEAHRAGASLVSTLETYHSILEWEDVDIIAPDISKRSTLLALAKMSSSAYDSPPDPPTWEPGFEGWNLTESFGWVENGIRGHIFTNGPSKEVIVVALKGTSAGILPGGDDTSRRDKLNDNLLFSCCCARVSWTWSPVCSCPFSSSTCSQPCIERSLLTDSVYYPLITDLYNNISYAYPTSQIWVTGHSLGGALSSLIGMTFGVPAITFEAPAERMAAKRLHLPLPPRMPKESDDDVPRLPITHVFHNADPIPMGTCVGPSSLCGTAGYAMESKCHAGDVVLYNTTGLLGWRENVATHRIANLVDDLLSEDWRDKVKKQRSAKSASRRRDAGVSWWPWKGKKGKGEDDGGEDDDDDSWLDELGEVPAVSDQRHCQDCETWEFVERDKTK